MKNEKEIRQQNVHCMKVATEKTKLKVQDIER